MGWLIALGIILLFIFLPLGICAQYDDRGPLVWASVGPVKIPIYPEKKKQKKDKPKKDSAGADGKKKKKSGSGGKLTDFLPLVSDVILLLSDLRRKLRIGHLECKLILAADDPCDLAINYGRAWAAVGTFLPLLEQVFVIRKRNVSVNCDFTADETTVFFRITGHLTVIRLLSLLAVHGLSIYNKFQNIRNKRKGGAGV